MMPLEISINGEAFSKDTTFTTHYDSVYLPLVATPQQQQVCVETRSCVGVDFLVTLPLEVSTDILRFLSDFSDVVALAQCNRLYHAVVWDYYRRSSRGAHKTITLDNRCSAESLKALAAVPARRIKLVQPRDHALAIYATIFSSNQTLQSLSLDRVALSGEMLHNFKFFGALHSLALRNCTLSGSGYRGNLTLACPWILRTVKSLSVEFSAYIMSTELCQVLQVALLNFAPALQALEVSVFCLARADQLISAAVHGHSHLGALCLHTTTSRDAEHFGHALCAVAGLLKFELSCTPGGGIPKLAPPPVLNYVRLQLAHSVQLRVLDLSGTALLFEDSAMAKMLEPLQRLRYLCIDGQQLCWTKTFEVMAASLRRLRTLSACGISSLDVNSLVQLTSVQRLCVRSCNSAVGPVFYNALLCGHLPRLQYLDVRNCAQLICTAEHMRQLCNSHKSLSLVEYNIADSYFK